MLKNIFPIGSFGSYVCPPRNRETFLAASSSAIVLASGTERASQSSFGTASVSLGVPLTTHPKTYFAAYEGSTLLA